MALRQAAFRFYANDGTEGTSTPLAALNTSITRQVDDASTFLIRFLIQADGGTTALNTVPQFQRNLNGGAFANITTTSSIVRAVGTSVFANAQDCTAILGGSGGFDANNDGCTHDGTAGGAQMDIAANGHNETVCAVQVVPADLQPGDVVQIRITSTPTAITIRNFTATVTITAATVDFTGTPLTGGLSALVQTLIFGLGTIEIGALEWLAQYEFQPTDVTVTPATGSLALVGLGPTIGLGQTTETAVGSVALVPQTASVLASSSSAVEAATLAISGQALAASAIFSVETATGSAGSSGLSPTVSAIVDTETATGSLVATGQLLDLIVSSGGESVPLTGSLQFTTIVPVASVSIGHEANPAEPPINIEGYAPTVTTGQGVTLTPTTEHAVVAGHPATFSQDYSEAANDASLIITGYPPTLLAEVNLALGPVIMTIGGYPPLVIRVPPPDRRIVPVGARDRQFAVSGRRRVFRVGPRGGAQVA